MKNSKLLEETFRGEIDPGYAVRANRWLEAMHRLKPKRVLDAGCGRGFFVRASLEFDFVEKVVGVELVQDRIDLARRITAHDSRAEIVQAKLEQLPFPDASFDFISCLEVIEHVPDERAVLRELRRVLKPGGAILFSVPNRQFPLLWDPLNWILMRTANTHVHKDIHWLAGIWADHERLYTESEFVELTKKFFTVRKSESALRWCWPFSHFLLYGVGKNLIERCGWNTGNRFDFGKKGMLSKALAKAFQLPSKLLDGRLPLGSSVQIVVEASKDLQGVPASTGDES